MKPTGKLTSPKQPFRRHLNESSAVATGLALLVALALALTLGAPLLIPAADTSSPPATTAPVAVSMVEAREVAAERANRSQARTVAYQTTTSAAPVKQKRVTPTKPKPKQKATSAKPGGFRFPVRTNTPAKRYAASILSPSAYACVHELWMRESGWSPTALGAATSSGRAFGIPQIKRMTTKDPLRQVDRGLVYIEHRYGSTCSALAHHNRAHWY